MFARISNILTILFFAMLTAASAVPRTDSLPTTQDQCIAVGGDISCCNSLQQASNPIVGFLAGLHGIALGPTESLVGLTCSPISIIGGGFCTSQSACCTGNDYGGLIVLGCSPININL